MGYMEAQKYRFHARIFQRGRIDGIAPFVIDRYITEITDNGYPLEIYTSGTALKTHMLQFAKKINL